MTKNEEKYLFKMFQEKYKDMPAGKVNFYDKPDVIVTNSKSETIGIELTECIYDESRMRISEFQIKFNEKVITQLEGHMPFKFHLDIELDPTMPLKQNQIETTIKEIIKICIQEFGNIEPYEFRSVEQLDVDWNEAPTHIQKHFREQGYRKLPKGILRIQLSRYDILTKSHHSNSKGGVVPNFTQKHLNAILTKKEKALKNYKTCNQQWLVIGEGGDFYSYMDEIEVEADFNTNFDKVFMYRRLKSEIVILK